MSTSHKETTSSKNSDHKSNASVCNFIKFIPQRQFIEKGYEPPDNIRLISVHPVH